jgi:hypothetical protein
MRFEEFAATRLPAVLRFAGVLTADRVPDYGRHLVLPMAGEYWIHHRGLPSDLLSY